MKYIALAVLLAVVQTAPPVPRKAPDSAGKASRNIKHARSDNKVPAPKPLPNLDSVAPNPKHEAGSDVKGTDEPKPVRVAELPPVAIRTTWVDCLSLLFAGALVGVGIYGVVMARRTLNAIERQAKANEEQLTEIQQSAEKTDRMILLAAQQAEYGRVSAEAAKDSAKAALLNAQAVINADRPWVMIKFEKLSRENNNKPMFRIFAVNDGKTLAKVVSCFGPVEDVFVFPDMELPMPYPEKSLNLQPEKFLAPDSPMDIAFFEPHSSVNYGRKAAAERERGDSSQAYRVVIYGAIGYSDGVSQGLKYSRFCYQHVNQPFSDPGGTLIFCGPPEYNQYT